MSCCIIHVGMHKTGTTSIQQSLKGFEDEDFVYFVDKSWQGNHSRAIFRLLESRGAGIPNPRKKSQVFRDVNKSVRRNLTRAVESLEGRNLIISGEGLIVLNKEELERLRCLFESFGVEVKIVAYVRPPAAFMTSVYLQRLKSGTRFELNPDGDYGNYQSRFRKFDEVFGQENVLLWKFDPKDFYQNCVVRDFCRRLDIEIPTARIVRVNESFSLEAAGLLYQYRKFSAAEESGLNEVDGYRLLVQLLTQIGGSKFRFSPDILIPILEKNTNDIKWMESRLGVTLHENIGKSLPADIRTEADMLATSAKTIDDLKKLLGPNAPPGISGKTPNEIAMMVHALRLSSVSSVQNPVPERGMINEAKKSEPDLLESKANNTRSANQSGLGDESAIKEIHFFVHIPKTAGTSFRIALQQNPIVRMLYDYGDRSSESSSELKEVRARELLPDHPVFHLGKYNFLCGHVNYQRYAQCVREENVISIVRNPVERIVSEYQHLKRHGGLTASFEEFSSSAKQQNKQWRLLKGLKIDQGALIGLTSHYKFFIELFSNTLKLPVQAISINNAPLSDTEERFNITPEAIKAAYQYNKKDMSFFFNLVQRFAESIAKVGYRTIPDDNTTWNCRIDNGKRVMGWLACGHNDCFFIVIGVNGESRVVVSLDQPRQDLIDKGLSDNAVCGFSYPLALLGISQGDRITVEVLGSAKFQKSFDV